MGDRVCPKCGYQLQPFDKECSRCARMAAEGRTAPVQPPGQGPQSAPPFGVPQPAAPPLEKVGFWARFVAAFIDGIVLAIISGMLGLVLLRDAPKTAQGFGTLVGLAYSVLLIGSSGQTLGMMALSIRVIRTDGTSVDYIVALIRWIGSLLSAFVLFLGYLWIAFDPDKQGWHDKIAGTYVVRT